MSIYLLSSNQYMHHLDDNPTHALLVPFKTQDDWFNIVRYVCVYNLYWSYEIAMDEVAAQIDDWENVNGNLIVE